MIGQRIELINRNENVMREVKLDKVILSCSGSGTELEKSKKLLEYITGKKASYRKSGPKTRIPDFGVRPLMEVGVIVTLRKKEGFEILKRLLSAIDNVIPKENINQNFLSFGIKEYIEIPGVEYKRELGMSGLTVTVVFARAGLRVKKKKIKRSKIPKKQYVTEEEIIKFMKENFKTEII